MSQEEASPMAALLSGASGKEQPVAVNPNPWDAVFGFAPAETSAMETPAIEIHDAPLRFEPLAATPVAPSALPLAEPAPPEPQPAASGDLQMGFPWPIAAETIAEVEGGYDTGMTATEFSALELSETAAFEVPAAVLQGQEVSPCQAQYNDFLCGLPMNHAGNHSCEGAEWLNVAESVDAAQGAKGAADWTDFAIEATVIHEAEPAAATTIVEEQAIAAGHADAEEYAHVEPGVMELHVTCSAAAGVDPNVVWHRKILDARGAVKQQQSVFAALCEELAEAKQAVKDLQVDMEEAQAAMNELNVNLGTVIDDWQQAVPFEPKPETETAREVVVSQWPAASPAATTDADPVTENATSGEPPPAAAIPSSPTSAAPPLDADAWKSLPVVELVKHGLSKHIATHVLPEKGFRVLGDLQCHTDAEAKIKAKLVRPGNWTKTIAALEKFCDGHARGGNEPRRHVRHEQHTGDHRRWPCPSAIGGGDCRRGRACENDRSRPATNPNSP